MLPDARRIEDAVALLDAGELVAFPTETVYGLGADAANAFAVARIFVAKGRPASHPLIVHFSNFAAARAWAADVPPSAERRVGARVEIATLQRGGQGLQRPEVAVVALPFTGYRGVDGVVDVVVPLGGHPETALFAGRDQPGVVHVALGDQ